MLMLILEAMLGRRTVRALRRLVAGTVAAVLLLVPGAHAAILGIAIHEEQARVAPVIEQMVRQISRSFDRGHILQLNQQSRR